MIIIVEKRGRLLERLMKVFGWKADETIVNKIVNRNIVFMGKEKEML